MWMYEKKLQYPVKIKNTNPKFAKIVMSQLGGPDGESGAAMRYLHQRFSCPYDKVTGILTDIGTEELAHMELVASIVHQLTRNLCTEEILDSGFEGYFTDNTAGIYPVSAGGIPFSVLPIASKGDIITDLHEDLAADGAYL